MLAFSQNYRFWNYVHSYSIWSVASNSFKIFKANIGDSIPFEIKKTVIFYILLIKYKWMSRVKTLL